MALATAEVVRALGRVSAGAISIATGGAVLFAGFLLLLAAAVLGLAVVLAPWLATLIVGGIVTCVGLLLVWKGRKTMDPLVLKPRRTAESLRKDKEALSRSAS
jgi:hypothetical protein